MPRDTADHPAHKPKDAGSPAVLIVLQWLSYSTWIWVLIALSWLLSATLTYFFISKGDSYELLLYVLAALVVLLPIGFVLDKSYAKREPAHKLGFAAVVLVLNAILVFLATLGAVITAVVSALTLVFRPESSTGATVAIVSAGVVAVLALMLFIRILNNPKTRAFTRVFPYVIVLVSVASLVLAIAGPIKAEYTARDDRLVEDNLSALTVEIRTYASSRQHLPKSLDDLEIPSYASGVQQLLDDRAVAYKIIEQPKPVVDSGVKTIPNRVSGGRFELCVTYHAKRGTGKYTNASYQGYLDARNHPAGRVCYKQSTY